MMCCQALSCDSNCLHVACLAVPSHSAQCASGWTPDEAGGPEPDPPEARSRVTLYRLSKWMGWRCTSLDGMARPIVGRCGTVHQVPCFPMRCSHMMSRQGRCSHRGMRTRGCRCAASSATGRPEMDAAANGALTCQGERPATCMGWCGSSRHAALAVCPPNSGMKPLRGGQRSHAPSPQGTELDMTSRDVMCCHHFILESFLASMSRALPFHGMPSGKALRRAIT